MIDGDHSPRWWRLGRLADLPIGAVKKVLVDDAELALVRTTSGEVFLLDGRCLHQDGPLFGGDVDTTTITCPWHRWRYDLRTGHRCDHPGSAIATHPVRVRDGWIEAAPHV